jgi:BMFP domain-containing protein YqiC
MQTRNKIFDDLSQLMTNAMGVAQGARGEAETAMKGWMDRWLADRDFVTREEFDAVRAMAQKAREENEALKARLDALEESAPVAPAPSPAKSAKKAASKKPGEGGVAGEGKPAKGEDSSK